MNHLKKHTHALRPHQTENIQKAFWINSSFALLELVGGIFTNSVAIMSDALHDFGDSISLGISWVLQKKANKEDNPRYTYGYHRLSLVGAIINSFILVVGCMFIIYKAVERFAEPAEVHTLGMLILAIVGVGVNYWAYFFLKKGSSVNEKVVALHFVEDILGWVAVLIGSIVMMLVDAPWIDPMLSLCIAAYILLNVYKNLKFTFQVILQAAPAGVDLQKIEDELLQIEGVSAVHDVHCWSLDGEFNIITLHVTVSIAVNLEGIELLKHTIREYLRTQNIHHATIEVER